MIAGAPLWEWIAAAFVLAGAVFALIGSWGLAKLSSFLLRLHGPSKATTLGVGCTLIASMLVFSFTTERITLHEVLITLFVFLTAPLSAHLLVKAAIKLDPTQAPPPPPPPPP